ncbi:MAG TPA: hypothetical protein VK524_18790 [Polyangiaceae bacterium]|nr:hypothetical protein [Polyangiaceae bacterium]
MADKRFVVGAIAAFGLLASSASAEGTFQSQESVAGYAARGLAPKRGESAEQLRVLPGGVRLRLKPGSVIQVQQPTRLPLYPGRPDTPAQVVQLVSGRMRVAVSPTSGVAVLIRAPRRVSAIVKSGEGTVLASSESVTVAAVDSDMLAALGDKWHPLPRGFAQSADDRDAMAKPRSILPAPPLAQVNALALAMAGTGSHELRWAAVPGATAYRVRISSSSSAPRDMATSEAQATFHELSPGRYDLMVFATDAYGLEGPGARSRLDVLGLELPEGARRVGDAIELGPGHRLRFSDPAGLELSYGDAAPFVAAPNNVGVVGGAATLVRVRKLGEKGEVAFRLLPRDVRADVVLGPAMARWPRDSIKIRVSLHDARGRRIAAPAKLQPEVRVNIDPVHVEWQRRGDVLEGTLAPRVERGPWVVRVQVKDEFGDVIGWASLEVAPL